MEPILLLHGALGTREQFDELRQLLSDKFRVYDFNFEGHGEHISAKDFSIDLFVQNTIDYIKVNNIEGCDVFGYSMGGYVALKLAKIYTGKINKLITLGTKLYWNIDIAEKEVKMLQPEIVETKVPQFAEVLKFRHSLGWKNVMTKTAQLMHDLGNGASMQIEDYSQIKNDVLIIVGSEDKMVTEEESQKVVDKLKNGKLLIANNFPHQIEKVDKVKLAEIIIDYLLHK